MRLKDQVVLITGSARGIGKEIAKTFANEGATVIISDINAASAEATSEEFKKEGFNSSSFACDVTSMKSVEEMINKILDNYSRIDILVNNAGITKDNLLLRMSENEWDAVLNTNLKGVFCCTKAVTKSMLRAKKGKIINIASIIGITGNAGQANYSASKAGIIGFTKSIAKEFSSRGITSNAVAPGFIQSDMTDKLTDKAREEIFKTIPLGKLGTPKDVANACLFLASSEADYITGQTIVVDGGMAI
ncbi:MAG: 3-oxoacyl-[acyl-carrier-protein] reductase [Omnitrophica WOR_2 bacterium GWF2_38_59]|nr:MAG: 3-oxoacyl-[acyl-carrier-protein] reductase [Omnitrophica WOR_2 bacterium GWA2_37_7]OGX26501.1 MAG: 3-oxoacyl-[acyl-carrier-protein] reductase [Omnitrophica WOR_2 bacterium GWF2_38_59]OGX49315.1 MAG: 3-oxoacyl-[acyl-carrier-protein] reductase [Omnitrophica WOR_2 bacterium RIFOXYA2_FULL_38_17]OGX51482.1 MAG: 3-oxoacyl-[acyl-carrier-protein] reductase [Omnitrophica WOR_2 bacterium RIFOXYA12_FULL_38_10]OGX55898.1 MAG: 3-oxoacyl-[acyl-carrier-protein] reductase [Omnitrophica WOR_2 bacterium 